MRKIKIRKGKHYPGIIPFNFPLPVWIKKDSTKTRQFEFLFDDTCLYNLYDEDQWDVNKLFGFSIGHHHNKSSFRFGWRAILEGNLIEIVAYEYHDGFRHKTMPICKVPLNQWNKFTLTYDNTMGRTTYEVNNVTFQNEFSLVDDHGLGYTLGVYFGGNEKAPQDVILRKRKLK